MIRLDQLSVQVGHFALRAISFEVQSGQHACLMGKTGTGKTTLLEALCGLRQIQTGSVYLMGNEVTSLPPAQRGIGFVPQDAALFEHLTIRQHLGFALAVRRQPQDQVEARVQELADLLGLRHLLDRRPAGLSGGETQRVALGRALSFRPPVLCLDEPLSALDEDTRVEMGSLLKTIRVRTGVTILHVTHNRWDAERLADRILLLRDGRVESKQ
jgi:molybdate/tungstate transport system ATP-binding protein